MTELLIDDVGSLWFGTARTQRENFDTPRSLGDFNEYAIRTLGFVGVSEFRQTCQIRFSPKLVTARNLKTLSDWLSGRKPARLVVATLTDGWCYEVFPDVISAMTAVAKSVEAVAHTATPLFLARSSTFPEKSLSVIAEQAKEFTAQDWKRIETLPYGSAITKAFGPRFAIVSRGESDKLIFEHLGPGMFAFDRTWRPTAIGKPVTMQPDKSYAEWINHAFEGAVGTRRSVIDEVDAITCWTGPSRSRWRYKRCVVPFMGKDGQERLLCGSILSPDIDLRFQSSNEVAHIGE